MAVIIIWMPGRAGGGGGNRGVCYYHLDARASRGGGVIGVSVIIIWMPGQAGGVNRVSVIIIRMPGQAGG